MVVNECQLMHRVWRLEREPRDFRKRIDWSAILLLELHADL
jgi:hypothetical protein